MHRPSQWLHDFAKNVTSQYGEDGILEKVLETVTDNDNWCVEFGAWDGKLFSNTYNLINNKDYLAVLIEADSRKFRDLLKTYKKNSRVIPLNAFVGFEKENGLDAILEPTGIPVNFDFLSIDIDGNDYHVWEAVQNYKPKVVVIEYNPTISNKVNFVQKPDIGINQGSSLLATDKLAKRKGYELVAVTKTNAIFVDSKYFGLFGIKNNHVDVMRTNESSVTYIFNGFDGTVFIRGYGKLAWHGIPYRESKIQPLPKWLRGYPKNYGWFKRMIAKLYRSLYKRHII
ncbi:MAG: hypothetical protein BBJ57_03015 [Desulfobacterales bacterium PC51MH44]|nr:MAG: hypothetical protein BBJ57_03015 [Desulfobacterales bacterium PC51MH44]